MFERGVSPSKKVLSSAKSKCALQRRYKCLQFGPHDSSLHELLWVETQRQHKLDTLTLTHGLLRLLWKPLQPKIIRH